MFHLKTLTKRPSLNDRIIAYSKEGYVSLNEGDGLKSIKTKSSFNIMPSNKSKYPDRIFICAKSGAGKSYAVAQYAHNYKKMYPNNNIYLFTTKNEEEEEMFVDLDFRYISIDRLIYEEKNDFNIDFIHADMFSNCLIVFDDADQIEKSKKKYLNEFRTKLLQVSRSRNVSIIITSHEFSGGEATRMVYNELTGMIIFNHCGMKSKIKECLKDRFSFSKETIDELIKIKDSRWTYISPNHPSYFITEKIVKLIDD